MAQPPKWRLSCPTGWARRNKEVFMIKSTLYAAIGFAAISSIALAEDLSSATAPLPPGTFTTPAHSDEWKIANALSAGPATITEHAAVIDWPANPKDEMFHGRMLRQGSNGWTCMPDVPGRPQHNPMCVDETMMKWFTATLEQPASCGTQISCSNTLEPVNFSAMNRFRLKAG
jgi:hypothetical protein